MKEVRIETECRFFCKKNYRGIIPCGFEGAEYRLLTSGELLKMRVRQVDGVWTEATPEHYYTFQTGLLPMKQPYPAPAWYDEPQVGSVDYISEVQPIGAGDMEVTLTNAVIGVGNAWDRPCRPRNSHRTYRVPRWWLALAAEALAGKEAILVVVKPPEESPRRSPAPPGYVE